MSTTDDLYDQFVERYFSTGDEQIPETWPKDVRQRCRLFLKLVQSRSSSNSVVTALSREGIVADLTLNAPENEPPEELTAKDERYVVEKEIARGGMGRILLAYDRDFRRRIAMKVLRSEMNVLTQSPRFLEEAQATAQLEHPNIAPVYDVGFDELGVPFFTMKWIRGRNIDEIVRARGDEFSQFRLVQILQQAAMAIEFAHSRGVVHRDLKPQNLMVRDYGEVLVVDWGLAKILGRSEDKEDPDRVRTTRAERGVNTLDGVIQGSIPYMAPEQARGEVDKIDQRTDVFALGGILYFILTGRPPYDEGSFEKALSRAQAGEVIPPGQVVEGPGVPKQLEEICLKALAEAASERFQSAREFHQRLQAYVEGIHDQERRAAEAARLLGEARAILSKRGANLTREEQLRKKEASLRRDIGDYDPPEKKESLWTLVDEIRAVAEEGDRLFNETTSAYRSVLNVDPLNGGAREALAQLYWERMLTAENRGDKETTRLYQGLVEQYQDGQYEDLLRGQREVRIETTPKGAEILLSLYETQGLVLVESKPEELGTTPLTAKLPMGSYVATLRKKGHSEVRYPFLVDRNASLVITVPLYRLGTIPEGFVQIPAGESILGGDVSQSVAFRRHRKMVPEFFVARFPVTLGEYCDFLNDRFASGPAAADDERLRLLIPAFDVEKYVERGKDGHFAPTAPLVVSQVPVMALRPQALQQYCSWLGQRLGKAVRFLTEEEWERCARGADGRLYPWGNDLDWAFCHGARSQEAALPQPVGAFAYDSSPFAVRDLAGCIREFCDKETEDANEFPCRGGSWVQTLPILFRADVRTLTGDRVKSTDIGFRVCYST